MRHFPQLPVQGAAPGTKNSPDVTVVNLPNFIQNKQSVTLRHVAESQTFLHVVPRLTWFILCVQNHYIGSKIPWIEHSSQCRHVALEMLLWLKHRAQWVTRFWDCLT